MTHPGQLAVFFYSSVTVVLLTPKDLQVSQRFVTVESSSFVITVFLLIITIARDDMLMS